MEINTHGKIAPLWCGEPVEVSVHQALVRLSTTAAMAVDDTGLVHGGFVFGLADHAAMLAVNHPNVVLGSAQTRYLKPVVVGDELVAEALVEGHEGKKYLVTVSVKRSDETVMAGEFVCFTPDRHVVGG